MRCVTLDPYLLTVFEAGEKKSFHRLQFWDGV